MAAPFLKSITRRLAFWTPVAILFNDNIVSLYSIEGTSMQPTLNPGGPEGTSDVVIVNKLSGLLCRYTRGDAVVIRSPTQPKNRIVKRLIGIEGDWLLAEDHPDIIKVPEGHCWVEGDNPATSVDSATEFGPLPLALIEGHVLAVVWPRLQKVAPRIPRGKVIMRSTHSSAQEDVF